MRETRSGEARPSSSPTTKSQSPTRSSSEKKKKAGSTTARRRTKNKMNNAENYAAVEVKRKSAKEEVMYELAERGEQQPQTQKRYFEKPDKPDDVIHSGKENGKETTAFGSLPPDDLRNIVILMVLCMSFLKKLHRTSG